LKIENVEIADLSGKIVEAKNLSPLQNGNVTINVSALSQGIYFVKIETSKGIVTKKFVKE
jgi:hypothetical protein